MTLFDTLIGELGKRFELGSNSAPLAREILKLIFDAPGGFAGFFGKIKSSGVAQAESWLGHADAAPLAAGDLAKILPASALSGIAARLHIPETAVTAATAFALPKLVGLLTPAGAVPAAPSADVAHFLASGAHGHGHAGADHGAEKALGGFGPAIGIAAMVAVTGFLIHLFSGGAPALPPSEAPNAPAAQVQHATAAPVVAQAPAALAPSTFSFSNENGKIHISGAVPDEQTRSSLLSELKAIFGDENIVGDIAVDAKLAASSWMSKIHALLAGLKIPGLSVLFDGNEISLGGHIEDDVRAKLSALFTSLFGGGVKIGSLSDHLNDVATRANANAVASLNALKPGFSAADLVGALNMTIINFTTASAQIPDENESLLHAAAAQIKQLPPETIVEVAGYTDNTGNDDRNIALSQRRAEAVREALIADGVDNKTLSAKGYGSANPIASNDSVEGRFRNRRIEYRLGQK